MKQAIELLYPTVIARPAQPQGRAGRGRGAHEVQNSDSWFSDWPMPMVDNQMAEWIEYYDPVEALAVNMVYEDEYAAIPEGLARELTTQGESPKVGEGRAGARLLREGQRQRKVEGQVQSS